MGIYGISSFRQTHKKKKRINNKFTNHPLALSWVACPTTILTPILNAYPHRILHWLVSCLLIHIFHPWQHPRFFFFFSIFYYMIYDRQLSSSGTTLPIWIKISLQKGNLIVFVFIIVFLYLRNKLNNISIGNIFTIFCCWRKFPPIRLEVFSIHSTLLFQINW